MLLCNLLNQCLCLCKNTWIFRMNYKRMLRKNERFLVLNYWNLFLVFLCIFAAFFVGFFSVICTSFGAWVFFLRKVSRFLPFWQFWILSRRRFNFAETYPVTPACFPSPRTSTNTVNFQCFLCPVRRSSAPVEWMSAWFRLIADVGLRFLVNKSYMSKLIGLNALKLSPELVRPRRWYWYFSNLSELAVLYSKDFLLVQHSLLQEDLLDSLIEAVGSVTELYVLECWYPFGSW